MTDGPAATMHATAVVIREAGILICGPSGAGKSSLAVLMIEAARLRHWFARLVADDRVLLWNRHGALVAAPHPATAGRIERRTQPIDTVDYEPRCRIALVVDLVPAKPALPRLPAAEQAMIALASADPLPHVRLQGPPNALWCGIVFDKLAAL